jgi:hypothetical protein
MDGNRMTTDEALDLALEALEGYCEHGAILRPLEVRDAIKQARSAPVQEPVAHCEAGPNYCQQCHKESLPTYGSEEVRKLREVIKSQAKIIESNKPPPWFNAVENILKEYGLQAIDFVADFKAAIVDAEQHAAQPAPVIPDVMTTAEGEHPEYVQGWNDCRQLMLQARKNK